MEGNLKAKPLPELCVLHECFIYDGRNLLWKERPLHHFLDEWRWKIFLSRNTGKIAGWKSPQGYQKVKIFNLHYMVHRIIWKMVYGEDAEDIDHINGDRLDNSITNLRNVTRGENGMNKGIPTNNTSGSKGVSQHSTRGYWSAYITVDGVRKHLGQFTSFESAKLSRDAAEKTMFGDFRRLECVQ